MAESKTKNKVFCLQNVNVSPYVNNKMGLSYLNWAFVVDSLKTLDPKSTYKVKQFPEINMKTGHLTARNVNYCEGVNGEGAYVTVTVIFRGASHTESLPCYDFKGRAVAKPDVMLVNKTIKRCYVKAAAMLTGLGISLYINGNPNGGNNNGRKSNHQYHSYHSASNRNYHRGSSSQQRSQVNNASQKQPKKWVVNNIKKQLERKTDTNPKTGKLFKSLYANRDNLLPAIDNVASMKHCSPAAAAYDIGKKYLDKLPDKTNKSKSQPSKSTGKAEQGSLLSNKQTIPPSSDNDVPF